MNEITSKPAASVMQVKPSSNTATGVTSKSVAQSSAPSEEVKPVTAEPAKHLSEHVEAAVKQMNEYIQSTQRDLHFSYDKDAGETVVKVLDRKTQEVIRQIPDEAFLKMAQTQGSEGGVNLFSALA